MKIVQINSTCGTGSTGKICVAVSELLTAKGIENYILYATGSSTYPLGRRYMSPLEIKCQALKSRIFGNYGFQAKSATKRLIRELESISPNIVHLHNLHSHNVHLGVLFNYLKDRKIKIYWTFHDCWAFTGYCPHYDMIGCDQWKKGGCRNCPQRRHYSWFFDWSSGLFEKKKELFSGLDLTIITPSGWLAGQVKKSFLQNYEVKVIHNGIDLSIFRPRESDFRHRYNLEGKFIVLGVSFDWGVRKGLDVFIELSKCLDERFQVVLVGTNDSVDHMLPENVISIHRTQNQIELAEMYSAADVFVNPTREENFPTVNLEALGCGIPIVTFDTGGCRETVSECCGFVVPKNDTRSLCEMIQYVCMDRPFSMIQCKDKAGKYCAENKFLEYTELYQI